MNREPQHEDGLDFKKFFEHIKNFIKELIILCLLIFTFYRKKAFLFIVLISIGMLTGFLIDRSMTSSSTYVQKTIIEPKYNTTKFIYDMIKALPDNLGDSLFLKEIGLEKEFIKNIKEISIEPIVQHRDILASYERYFSGNTVDIHHVIEDLEFEKLKGEKYRDFFSWHMITSEFYKENDKNTAVINRILKIIKENSYFDEERRITMQQSKTELEQNQKTLEFINQYLAIQAQPGDKANSVVVVGGENDIPTVASLLKQKDLVVARILKEERNLELNNEIFSIVREGKVIEIRKPLHKRLTFLLPLFLFILVSIIYLLRFVSRRIMNFLK